MDDDLMEMHEMPKQISDSVISMRNIHKLYSLMFLDYNKYLPAFCMIAMVHSTAASESYSLQLSNRFHLIHSVQIVSSYSVDVNR